MRNLAFCTELPSTGAVPDWIQLLPPGPNVTGKDGRVWRYDAATVVAAFNARQRPIPLDWEHSSSHRAPQGLDAPAAGWIVELAARADGIWGRVEWTERGRQQVVSREYKFVSPAFLQNATTGEISEIVHAGLTNQPNLPLMALNQAGIPAPLPLSPEHLAICRATGKDPKLFALELAKDAQQQAALNQSSPGEREQIIDQIARATGKDPAALKAEIARQTSVRS